MRMFRLFSIRLLLIFAVIAVLVQISEQKPGKTDDQKLEANHIRQNKVEHESTHHQVEQSLKVCRLPLSKVE